MDSTVSNLREIPKLMQSVEGYGTRPSLQKVYTSISVPEVYGILANYFSATQEYLPRILRYTDTLVAHISKNAGSPVDVSEWFNYFMLDIMGDLAFGKPFNYMKPEERVGEFDFKAVMHDSAHVISALGQVSYSFIILSLLGAGGDVQRFLDFCTSLVSERKTVCNTHIVAATRIAK